MRTIRIILIIISIMLISVALIYTDYHALFSRQNLDILVVIIVSILNIVALILSNRHETRKKR